MKDYIKRDKELTASRIKMAMKTADKRAVDIVNATGISKSTMSLLMHGRMGVSVRLAELLSDQLKVNPVWLMGFDVPMYGWEAEDLSKRKTVSNAIRKQIRLTGKTLDDIALALGITNRKAEYWVEGLEFPNFLQITELAELFGCGVSELLETKKCIPIVGRVQAGEPTLATQEIEGYIDVPEIMGDDYFALRIKGDSMSPRMQEGDVIIVKQQSVLDKGDIGVFLVDEEATVKKYMPLDNCVSLVALNPNYSPMVFNEITILGKVVELRAKI